MKTQASKKLTFNKKNIVELNDRQLQDVKGGGTTDNDPFTIHNTTKCGSIIPPLGTGWLCGEILAEMQ